MVSESLQSNTQTRTSPVPTNQTKHQKNTGQPARGQGSATRGQRGASSGRGGGIVGRQGSHSGQCSTHLDEDKSNESDYIPIGFTLDNFKSQLGNWTKPSLRQVLSKSSKNNSNRVPPKVHKARHSTAVFNAFFETLKYQFVEYLSIRKYSTGRTVKWPVRSAVMPTNLDPRFSATKRPNGKGAGVILPSKGGIMT
ncbi:hypothetical protein PSTG_06900 [Puccinia striiformis f. sp. tritici PST-78]|uniref:Uncharacterized protein n=1 Tax=Puccinia striiformis f. sp. tritici PST-78 TaxID=1165861 RepID=A0A0L0VKR4_9BASI|nr:hypothetical protein PSTG_06900 [Puccinia striiformis f. sp. tritici PST-78]